MTGSYHERRWIPGTCLEVHSAVAPGRNHCERLHSLSLRHKLHPQKGANTIESVTNSTQTWPSCVCYAQQNTHQRRSWRSDSQTFLCVHGSSAVVSSWGDLSPLRGLQHLPKSWFGPFTRILITISSTVCHSFVNSARGVRSGKSTWAEASRGNGVKWMMKILVTLWVVAGIQTSSMRA